MSIKSEAVLCPKCYGVAMIVDVDGDISLVCRTQVCRGSRTPSPPTERNPLPRPGRET